MSSAVLYDRDCGFCRTCVGVLLAWDRRRRLRPVAIQSPEGERLLADLTKEERLDSWHLVTEAEPAAAGRPAVPTSRRRSAGAAFPDLLRELPAGAPLAIFAGRLPGASERGYRWVAGHRGPLSRAVPVSAKRWADKLIANRG